MRWIQNEKIKIWSFIIVLNKITINVVLKILHYLDVKLVLK